MTHHKGTLVGYSSEDKQTIRLEFWKRAQGLCQICYEPVALEDMTLDHIIPRARGGNGSKNNLQVTHAECNQRKDAEAPTLPAEDILKLNNFKFKLQVELELTA